MDSTWKRWCRLCASSDRKNSHINMFLRKAELAPSFDVINKCFSVNISPNEDPSTICTNCYQFVKVTIAFREKTLKVQAMFAELRYSRSELDAGQLKIQYNILDDEELQHCSDVGPSYFEPRSNVNPTPIKEEDLAKINDDEEHSDQPLSPERNESSDEYNTSEAGSDDEIIDELKQMRGRLRNDEPQLNKVMKAKETFTCDECQTEFTQCKRYRIHMQSEHGIKLEFSCTECSKSYSTAKRLKNHKKAHQLSIELSCTECSKSFRTLKSLESHRRIHLPQEEKFTVPCKICNKMFTKPGAMQQHIRSVPMDEKPFICDQCSKTYKPLVHLPCILDDAEEELNHSSDVGHSYSEPEANVNPTTFKDENLQKINDDEEVSDQPLSPERNESSDEYNGSEASSDDEFIEEPKKKRGRPRNDEPPRNKIEKAKETFKCDECRAEFTQCKRYRIHMQSEHGIKLEFSCTECSKSYSTAKRLENHKKAHLLSIELSCTECSKSFRTLKSLESHKRRHLPKEEKFTVPCKICNKKFTNAGVVQQHIRSVHMDEKPFICDQCGKTYKSFGSLKEHKQTHNEDRPFHCKFCEKRFKTKTRLKIHTDTHNETTYICPVCGLQLNTRRTLNTHMVVHSDQKRYKCDFCGNDFKRAKALKNHLILHTGLKPYKCNFCDKSFAAGSSCRAHKRTAHPKELAAMEEAGEQCHATNVPNLEQLRSITSNRSLCV